MGASQFSGSLKFAAGYAIGIFALGFVLGTIRTLILAPRIGAMAAVTLEIPVVLLVSWFFSRYLIHKLSLANIWQHRLLSGLLAFVLLMILELTIVVAVFKQSPSAFVKSVQTTPGLTGLLGQLAFGFIPLIQNMVSNKSNVK